MDTHSFDGSDDARGGCLNRFGVGSQIDLDHPRIRGHLCRQAFGDLFAMVEDHHGFGRARPRMPALAERSSQHDVVEQRQPPERAWDLKGAADPLVDDTVGRSASDLLPRKADRADGRRARVPESMLKIVLFPDPFGPINPRTSPSASANETSLTAMKPPNRLKSPVTSSTETRSLRGVGRVRRQLQHGLPLLPRLRPHDIALVVDASAALRRSLEVAPPYSP